MPRDRNHDTWPINETSSSSMGTDARKCIKISAKCVAPNQVRTVLRELCLIR